MQNPDIFYVRSHQHMHGLHNIVDRLVVPSTREPISDASFLSFLP